MKKLSIAIIAGFGLAIASSCDEELPTMANFSDYSYSSLDEDAGSWVPVLLSASDQIAIDPPTDGASSEFLAEVADVKSLRANLTADQKKAVEYWTSNPVIRWNEIALELVAKYNLIPGPNEDDTYTLPNPTNPEGPPAFPFAHPPYACRAFAYLSVAQFDGLLSAWHYKYTYNRQSPYNADASIEPAYEKNSLPSYPSDGAVIAEASRAVLTAMFPLEATYLAGKADEHKQSLLWAGINVESDVAAGEVIGSGVAAVALARASTDGMRSAQAPKAVSDSIKAAAFERFGWQWDNLELPTRPVGLTPLFGKVQMWSVPTVEEVRPGPPPAPGSAEFEENVRELKHFADNMTDEWRAIANFWQDGLGTYTPPGHWNRFAKDFIIKYKLNPVRSARTFAYMNMAIMDAGISCWDAKYYYHYPRPIQMIPGFKTIAGTPNFPSYTSGHSAFSAAAAAVLANIFPAEADLVNYWAEEAAISRVYGGIHYRFDAEVGTEQGRNVAQYTIDIMENDGAN